MPKVQSQPYIEDIASENDEFFPMPRTLFNTGLVGFDLYVLVGNQYVLYWSKDNSNGTGPGDLLLERNIDTVFVKKSDEKFYNLHVEQYLPVALADKSRSSAEKAQILHSCSINLVRQVLQNPAMCHESGIQMTQMAVEHLVDQMVTDPDMFYMLARLTSHHYRTYTHSVDVCTHAIALARHLGQFERAELRDLGLGAMLHDVGKSKISSKILNRRGPLSISEWKLIKQHPQWGWDIVSSHYNAPPICQAAILQHHEKCNGTGYPQGLAAGTIETAGMITTVVDVYTALTANRAYRDALVPFDALKTMVQEMRGALDSDILKEFILLLGDVNITRKDDYSKLGEARALQVAV